MKEEFKQVILVCQDLNMPKGKLAAMVAHASTEAIFKSSQPKIKEWRSQGMKKVVLKVADEKELLKFKKLADKEKLVNALIMDAGKTFFKKPTKTCLAIGPDKSKKIDKITGLLKIL